MKDKWNAEVEGLVRRAQSTDWNEVRVRWERRLGNVWDKMRAEGADAKSIAKQAEQAIVQGMPNLPTRNGVKVDHPSPGDRLLEEPVKS